MTNFDFQGSQLGCKWTYTQVFKDYHELTGLVRTTYWTQLEYLVTTIQGSDS
jgi:hypothetical protein